MLSGALRCVRSKCPHTRQAARDGCCWRRRLGVSNSIRRDRATPATAEIRGKGSLQLSIQLVVDTLHGDSGITVLARPLFVRTPVRLLEGFFDTHAGLVKPRRFRDDV